MCNLWCVMQKLCCIIQKWRMWNWNIMCNFWMCNAEIVLYNSEIMCCNLYYQKRGCLPIFFSKGPVWLRQGVINDVHIGISKIKTDHILMGCSPNWEEELHNGSTITTHYYLHYSYETTTLFHYNSPFHTCPTDSCPFQLFPPTPWSRTYQTGILPSIRVVRPPLAESVFCLC